MFSLDSKFMQIINRITDLLILNLLFVVTSIPVVTIGASMTAMYTVCFRFDEDWEEGVFKTYFRAFRSNFRQATVIWLILALILFLCVGDFLICLPQTNGLRYLAVVAAILGFLALLTFSLVFPLLSRFDNTVKNTLKNAVLLSMAYAPHAILLGLLNAVPVGLFLVSPYLAARFSPLFLLIYHAAAAYLGSKVLKKPFRKLMPPEEEPEKITE